MWMLMGVCMWMYSHIMYGYVCIYYMTCMCVCMYDMICMGVCQHWSGRSDIPRQERSPTSSANDMPHSHACDASESMRCEIVTRVDILCGLIELVSEGVWLLLADITCRDIIYLHTWLSLISLVLIHHTRGYLASHWFSCITPVSISHLIDSCGVIAFGDHVPTIPIPSSPNSRQNSPCAHDTRQQPDPGSTWSLVDWLFVVDDYGEQRARAIGVCTRVLSALLYLVHTTRILPTCVPARTTRTRSA